MAFLPLAIGLAILHYRLYEIDRVVPVGATWAPAAVGMRVRPRR